MRLELLATQRSRWQPRRAARPDPTPLPVCCCHTALTAPVAVCGAVQVKMIGNAALDGGAVNLQSGSSMVIKGRGNFAINNTAGRGGGAFGILDGGSLQIDGRLCASGNKAEFTGGFAAVAVDGSQLVFATGSETYFADITQTCCGDTFQNTIVITTSGSNAVRCGVGAPSWTPNKLYAINGSACACNASFVAVLPSGPYVNECDTPFPADCNPFTWEDRACVSVPVPRPVFWSLLLLSCLQSDTAAEAALGP